MDSGDTEEYAETYLEVGLALGRAMVELIQSKATVDASMR